MNITEARRRVKALGGKLIYVGSSREFPPGRRPYWNKHYRLTLPGQPDQTLDRLSVCFMDFPEPSPSEDADL